MVTGLSLEVKIVPFWCFPGQLKEKSLLAIRNWNEKFGEGYPKLKLGFNYLKYNKKVDALDFTVDHWYLIVLISLHSFSLSLPHLSPLLLSLPSSSLSTPHLSVLCTPSLFLHPSLPLHIIFPPSSLPLPPSSLPLPLSALPLPSM